MKSPLSLLTLSICFALMISCGKTDSVEPTVDKALLKNDCKVETSEVAYKDQDLVNTYGFPLPWLVELTPSYGCVSPPSIVHQQFSHYFIDYFKFVTWTDK